MTQVSVISFVRYSIYKTTNLINGKFYIGKHQTKNIYDRYLGSGKALLKAIKKYGRANFIKEILFDFDTEQEMNDKEKELVSEELIKQECSYNMGVGGEGGPHFLGRKHSPETISKIIQNRKQPIFSDEARQRISEFSRNRKFSDESLLKMRIKAFVRHGKSQEEAEFLARQPKEYGKLSRSEAQKKRFSNKQQRSQISEKLRKVHLEVDLKLLKKLINQGVKPKLIRQQLNISKNKYDYCRELVLQSE